MSKKSRSSKANASSNNGMQLSDRYLDNMGEQMLTSCSLAISVTGCSPIFRHAGPHCQTNNKIEFEISRDVEVAVASNFSSPMTGERDLIRSLISPQHEAIKDVLLGRPSSIERLKFSSGNGISSHSLLSDRQQKFFTSATSPIVIQSHLLTSSLSFPMASNLDVSKRTRLFHSHPKRHFGDPAGIDGFNMVDHINLGSNMSNAVYNRGAIMGDVNHPISHGNFIEVKKEPSYRPQVEAISPTGSGDEMSPSDSDSIRHSKEEILQNINRLDRFISSVDQKVNKLRRLKEPLEEKSNQSSEEQVEKPTPAVDLSKLGIAHSIYSENRAKALGSHQFMKASGFEHPLPLYHNPSDVRVYHENILRHATFRPHLIGYIKKRKIFETKRDLYLCKKYDRLSEEWVQRLDKVENNQKKRTKDAKTREIFEKVFPDLRRKREEKERLAKMVKKSEVDPNADTEEAEVRMRTGMAAEPPIMLNALERRRGFRNENGRIHDNFELGQLLPGMKRYYWTKNECDTFREAYVAHPKNFARIATQLQNKTIQDCIYFYYITKKEVGYKQLVRRHNMSRRKHDKAKKAHKEVKEEKIEEHEESKDIKFLPSSPAVYPPSLSSSSSLYTYQFKLPPYLLLPTSSNPTTSLNTQSESVCSPSSSLPSFPVKNSSPLSPPAPDTSVTCFLGGVKQEPGVKSTPPSSVLSSSSTLTSSSSLLMASSSTGMLSSILPICSKQLASSESHALIEMPNMVPAMVSHPLFHCSSPTSVSLNQSMPTAMHTFSSPAMSNLSGQQINTLPVPLQVGGSIVQGTPVAVTHSNDLMGMWQLQFLLQQQFHQQQRQVQEQAQFNHSLSAVTQESKTASNQATATSTAQEARGSIIKGTPNHLSARELQSSHGHHPPATPGKTKQDRSSPASGRGSPKRPPSGKLKTPSRNENSVARIESGLVVLGEEVNRQQHIREILIDDYMMAQKMNSQHQQLKSHPLLSSPACNFDPTQSKKQNLAATSPAATKRKLNSLSSSDGLIYFAGVEVPKGSLCHSSLGNESARSLIDTIISQSMVNKGNEEGEERGQQKNCRVEGTESMSPTRGGLNFQSPGALPAHFFPTSSGPSAAALQSSMMMQSLLPPFFASSVPLLQGSYHPMYAANVPVGASDKVHTSTGKVERPNFASPPPAQHSPLPLGTQKSSAPGCQSSNHTPSRNGHEGGGKTTPRNLSSSSANSVNNAYSYISSAYNVQIPVPVLTSSAPGINSAFGQLAPPMNSHAPPLSVASTMMSPSTTQSFHPSASFLQMFSLGQFMTSFPLQMPQQLSAGSGGLLTAMAGVVPKSTSVTSGSV